MEGRNYMDLKPLNNKGEPSSLRFNKKAIIAASVIVGVLFLVGVSYRVYYKMSGIANKQIENQTTKIDTNQTLPGANINSNTPVNEVSSWQTFSDTTLGFEVKYPKEWALQRVNSQTGANDSSGKTVILWSKKNYADFIPLVGEKLKEGIYSFSIRYNDTTRSNYINDPEVKTLSSESITVAGVTGTKDKFKGPYGEWTTVYLNKGEITYLLYLTDKNKEQKEISDKILSTFKFLDKSSNMSDWQTYKNDKYGFSVQYPPDWIFLEDSGINYDSSVVSIASPKTQENRKKAHYGLPGDVSIYYYPSIADEPENKVNKIGATTLEELVKNVPTISKIGTVKLGGVQATDVIWGGHTSDYVVLAAKDSHLYKVSFFNKDSKDKLTLEEKQILSTFKFTSLEDFSVKELNIKFKVAKELKDDLIYSYRQDTDQTTGKSYKVALFSTKTLMSKDKNCAAEAAPLGAFSKYEGKKADYDNPYLENRDSEIKQLDTFFVHYAGPQAPCSTDVEYETNQLRLFNKNFPSGIEEIK